MLQMRIILRRHACSNVLKILSPKTENFRIQKGDNFHISAKIVDYGYSLELPRQGGSTIYFLGRNKKNNVYPCNPRVTI